MPCQNECAINMISLISKMMEEDNKIILNNILKKIREDIGFNICVDVKELNEFISFARIGNDINCFDIFVEKYKNKSCNIYVFYVINKKTIRTEMYKNFSDFAEKYSWCLFAIHDIMEIYYL